MISDHIFRAYDIRGIVGEDFDANGAYSVGKAYATYLIRHDGIAKPSICVGRDGRLSGREIQKAFIEGVLSTGADVTDIEESTSPLLFFSICHGKFDGGVNITASHNPRDYNGFKLQRQHAHAICGDEILAIRDLCHSDNQEEGSGNLKKDSFQDAYFEKITSLVSITGNPKIVFDAGNGITGKFAPDLFTSLGVNVRPLYCEVDGNFPHHDADPEVEENLSDLKRAVKEEGADLGVAFDGDGDRVGFVDAEGNHYSADLILLLLSRDLLQRHPKAKIVIDLKATQVLFEEIRRLGGEGIMVKTGHSFVEEKMRETHALLGGEVSGHLFFGENYYGFDDAFLAAAKVIEILQKSGKSLAEHFQGLPKVFNTPEIKVECPEEKKFLVVQKLVDFFLKTYGPEKCLTIDGIRIDFGDGAWGIVRASNTSPKITLRFEARTPEKREEIRNIVEGKLHQELKEDLLLRNF
ncbi:phosphomannomutase/phosphoglucomutase [Candidatus Peregrinibacteria bacterium]|nr:MAG: phosphomannomutase/phosphoglucomutase [Candidatus Peregrinibacteria bacterium]